MISHDHKVIFIHIPKCAGTSVERAFGHWDGFPGRKGQDHRPMRMIQQPVPLRHALRSKQDAKLYAKRFRHGWLRHDNPNNAHTVTAEQFASYHKFTIVRDPWSRTYSWYRNVMKDPLHLTSHGIDASMDFPTFVRRFAGKGMIAPSGYWLKAFDGGTPLDQEIRFDDLETGFDALRRHLNRPDLELGHHHGGPPGGGLQDVFDAQTRDRIGEVYAEEIARYGFTYDAAVAA